MKLYDKEENGKMMAAELAHTLLSLGERLEDAETDVVLKDCMDQEDDDGFIPYERKLYFFLNISVCTVLLLFTLDHHTALSC